jgi:hypothetical protein
VPVQLLAATQDTTLNDTDRSVLMDRLPAEHVAAIESGHINSPRATWVYGFITYSDSQTQTNPARRQ